MESKNTKLAIVGIGNVGSAIAYASCIKGLVSEIVLIDINKKKAEGEVMDLNHGLQFTETKKVYAGNYSDCKEANFIVVSAGRNQEKGETRLDLVNKNVEVLNEILPKILKYTRDAIIIMVTNPVDILTYAALKISNFPTNQVLGSGTVLDTARFRFLIGQELKISPNSIHAYIMGEHGDSEFPVWSIANIAGKKIISIPSFPKKKMDKMFIKTKMAAYEIIKRKGATYYAIGLVTTRIIESILFDQKSILPVSTVLNGQYGIRNVALSVPCIVGRNGIEKIIEIPINAEEKLSLIHSANTLKKIIKNLF